MGNCFFFITPFAKGGLGRFPPPDPKLNDHTHACLSLLNVRSGNVFDPLDLIKTIVLSQAQQSRVLVFFGSFPTVVKPATLAPVLNHRSMSKGIYIIKQSSCPPQNRQRRPTAPQSSRFEFQYLPPTRIDGTLEIFRHDSPGTAAHRRLSSRRWEVWLVESPVESRS